MPTDRLMNGLVDRWIRSGSKAQKLIKMIEIKRSIKDWKKVEEKSTWIISI